MSVQKAIELDKLICKNVDDGETVEQIEKLTNELNAICDKFSHSDWVEYNHYLIYSEELTDYDNDEDYIFEKW
jgi:hypothetical protein